MKLLFIFINVLFSIKNESASLEDNMNLERRSSGLYKVLFKPYVLELLNSKAVADLKRTPCWTNLHFLMTKPEVYYLAKMPIARALFRARIPEFQEYILNLKKGPSAAKGTLIIKVKMKAFD